MRIVILGAGGVGSFAAREVARRGHEVVVLEQFGLDHDRGSSFGESRIVRRVYLDPYYTGLMAAAYPLWDSFLSETKDDSLFVKCGGLYLGPASHQNMRLAARSMDAVGVRYEDLDAGEACKRFPAVHLSDDERALYDPEMGFANASGCVRAAMTAARSSGAVLLEQTSVDRITQMGTNVRITLSDRKVLLADRLLIAAGPWAGPLLKNMGLSLPLRVTRQTYLHLAPAQNAAAFKVGQFPVWIDAASNFYGFPQAGGTPGVKIALHVPGDPCTPEDVSRELTDADRNILTAYAACRLPDLSTNIVHEKVCLYTNTPDEDFVVDSVPGLPGVFVIGGLSGHGFKFMPLMGQIAADWLTDTPVTHDLSRFSLSRFSTKETSPQAS